MARRGRPERLTHPDVSVAGRRAGLNAQTRSGLWLHVARAVAALRPCLVVIENVRGLLTSPAGSPGDVEPCPWCLGDTAGQPALRALGAVLGSLADLGYDAKWLVLRASDVGAPHRRERTFLAAWPAGHPAEDADQQHREERRQPASIEAEERGARSEPGRRGRVAAAADAEGVGRNQGLAEPAARQWRHDPAQHGCVSVADAEGERHGHPGPPPREGMLLVNPGPFASPRRYAVGRSAVRWLARVRAWSVPVSQASMR
ncbi:DNA cytosine methyltransferase, partial [Streptomyces olivaceus]|uniref:DNA cytosine methyltransferase n=1 Tax=Streptomyces olivaceus TaxID=47716 RepID=UPI001CCA6A85|nr:DNA cytosine methyltransferase [Streptomyces olivaceus]MBZ6323824.1 DNA cytosine methyltransferase [Streptomyces olivaceus]